MSTTEEFEEIDLYETLKIAKDASENEVKKAYRKRALKCHPDKAQNDDEKDRFHHEFQKVSLAYGVLSDPKRRARYDRTGSLDAFAEDEDTTIADLFSKYGRPEVTLEMIEEDKKEYRESGDERKDILKYYSKGKGDMDVIFEHVIHSNLLEDEERFRDIIQEAIEKGEVKAYKAFTTESKKSKSKRRSAAQREAQEAEELSKELGIKDKTEQDLALMIRSKGESKFNSMIANLEEKYSKPKPKKSKKAE